MPKPSHRPSEHIVPSGFGICMHTGNGVHDVSPVYQHSPGEPHGDPGVQLTQLPEPSQVPPVHEVPGMTYPEN